MSAWRDAARSACGARKPKGWLPSAPPPPTSPHCPQLFTRRAAAAVFSNQRLQRWCFDVELIYVAQALGVPISGAAGGWERVRSSMRARTVRMRMHARTHASTHPGAIRPPSPALPEVQVNWTEMAGSKIRVTSILHMAFELATLKVGRALGGGGGGYCWGSNRVGSAGGGTRVFAPPLGPTLTGRPGRTPARPQLCYQWLGLWRVYQETDARAALKKRG